MISRENIMEHQRILKMLNYYDGAIDGLRGPRTNEAAFRHSLFLCGIKTETILPPGQLSEKAESLIIEFEIGGGKADYEQRYRHPIWPEGDSGITIGIGYDLGYVTREEFESDWKDMDSLPRVRLASVVGLKALGARMVRDRVKDISVSWDLALAVFRSATLPKEIEKTVKAFPGADKLPADVLGALVSLVYNRGPGMSGERRREMREIRELVATRDLQGIANEFRAMKRVWAGEAIEGGMRRRREAEAKLIESAVA